MIKTGFSLNFFKKKKSEGAKPQVVFYTTRPKIVKHNRIRKLRQLVWRPKVQPRSFRTVAGPMARVGLGVVLILLVYVLLGSRLLLLTQLEIKGNHLVPTADIAQVVFKNGFKPVNALLFNDARAAKQIETNLPQVRLVHFEKQVWSRKLVITIEEHETTIIWQTNNQRFMVNRLGVIYDMASDSSPLTVVEDLKNIPVNLNQKIVTTDFIEFVTSVVANLPRKTNLVARRIVVPETTFEIEVITSEGWKIILDTTRSSETQLNNLVRVLKTTGNPPRYYVDLRIEDRIYYR